MSGRKRSRGWNRQKYYLRNVGPFSIQELISRAIIVRTRDQDVYVNLHNGQFARQSTPGLTVSATQAYQMAQMVLNSEAKPIAVAKRHSFSEGHTDNLLRRVVLEPKADTAIGGSKH